MLMQVAISDIYGCSTPLGITVTVDTFGNRLWCGRIWKKLGPVFTSFLCRTLIMSNEIQTIDNKLKHQIIYWFELLLTRRSFDKRETYKRSLSRGKSKSEFEFFQLVFSFIWFYSLSFLASYSLWLDYEISSFFV
jgi:hypothetical protein